MLFDIYKVYYKKKKINNKKDANELYLNFIVIFIYSSIYVIVKIKSQII